MFSNATKAVLMLLASVWLLPALQEHAGGADPKSKERESDKITVKAEDAKVQTKFKVQKGEWMQLEVQGKWRMWDKGKYVAAQGHRNMKKINAIGHLGALVVQVGSSPAFTLEDELPFRAPASGEVCLWPNRGNYAKLKADGELTVILRSGEGLKEKRDKTLAAAKEAAGKLQSDPAIQNTLAALNDARRICGLQPVTLSAPLSIACQKHCKYLVVNKGNPLIEGLKAHQEFKELKEYSEEGAAAGKRSVLAPSPPSQAVAEFLGSFYHRMPLLDPKLKEVGIGYCQEGKNARCGIDFQDGVRGDSNREIVYYPEDGQKDVSVFFTAELPTPLPADHRGRAGFPITVQFTGGQKVTSVKLKVLGPKEKSIACYLSTPESPAGTFPQKNTVCAIPSQPLARATTYTVELRCTVSGKPHARTWRFTTEK